MRRKTGGFANNRDPHTENWSQQNRIWSRKSRVFIMAFLAIIMIYLLFFLPTSYFIFQPGSAEEIKPMVNIEHGFDEEQGTFMLTTVRMTYSNAVTYVMALFNPNADIAKRDSVFRDGESVKEYTQRQDYVMLTAQSDAIRAAYNKAGVAYHIKDEGVIVLQTIKNMPAASVLQAGDRIHGMDGTEMKETQQLLDYLKDKKAGESVKITYERGDKQKIAVIALAELPSDTEQSDDKAPRAGLGILPANIQTVQAERPDQQVEIEVGDIGGPSAGLMFSLEIYNQLVPEDITKGYRIAGTGTITPDGDVGVIGGIHHKVIAAHREKADIFFAPADYHPTNGAYQPIENTTDAMNQAKKIKTNMIVVSVTSLGDALKYLGSLPPKQ